MRLVVGISGIFVWVAVALSGYASVNRGLVSREETRPFFPLHPGTLWVYQVRDGQGRVALERVVVRGRYRLDDRKTDATVVEESGGMSGDFDLDVAWHPILYYRHDQFFYKLFASDLSAGELRELPPGTGEEKLLPEDPAEQPLWQSDFQIFRIDTDSSYRARTSSVAQVGTETVEVHAGSFPSCLRVDSESRLSTHAPSSDSADVHFHYVDWYAPGVGLVKSEARVAGIDRPIWTIELLSFRDGTEHP